MSFTDSLGRTVELPADITRIAPSGAVATMLLAAIAPECMVTINAAPSENQMAFLPANLAALPETGQMYGSKANLNLETLLAADPQVVIDLGDKKGDMTEDLDALQAQIGIPVVFIEADLDHMAAAFRTLGGLLSGKSDRGEELASLVDRTAIAEENAAKITDDMRVRAMYTTGEDGLGTNAAGSVQAQVLDMVGVENAVVVEDVSSKGGGNIISLEQLYNFDPDVILFASLDETLVDRAYLISPIVDMEKLICNMMQWSGVTEQELALTSIETVSAFAKQHHAGLTVMPGGEHWFHTEEQMQFLDHWIRECNAKNVCC